MIKYWDIPVVQISIGLVVFYLGLKMFAGGMKSLGNVEHLEWFVHNPYLMFLGGIVCTLAWQSSSLSTTAIIALVASGFLPLPSAIAAVLGANIGTTGTIWLAGLLVSDSYSPTPFLDYYPIQIVCCCSFGCSSCNVNNE